MPVGSEATRLSDYDSTGFQCLDVLIAEAFVMMKVPFSVLCVKYVP